MIKKVLFILSLLLLFVLDQKITNQEDSTSSFSISEYIQDNKGLSGALQEQLNYEDHNYSLYTGLCLTNRIQLTSEYGERLVKLISKQFESLIQKEQNLQNKTSETLLVIHTLNFSSLRMRYGHWIYALRKIII